MSRKFYRKFMQSRTFEEWIERLRRFNCALIRENNLQMWTMQHFKDYWTQNGRTL